MSFETLRAAGSISWLIAKIALVAIFAAASGAAPVYQGF
jgi:hypothetical protein